MAIQRHNPAYRPAHNLLGVNVRVKTAQKCEIKWTKRSREKTVGLGSYGLFCFEKPKGNEYGMQVWIGLDVMTME